MSSGGIGLVLVAVTMLVVAGVVTLALLKKVLDSPEREVRVRVRVAVFPRPRIEIDAKAASGGVDKI
ncbi:hypothetical protein ACFWY9_26205 [Amycolatopsis sp. NPDC059027]|uniref:hypothetical protein n=1 Tax=Amycolatopsis sp. NPDC059027 TaxID=3346709 RepID=UPI00367268A1